MKLATWNVNSLRARADRAAAFLARHSPDVVCLQELKAEEADLPMGIFRDAGYHAHVLGQRTYNGVGIFSRAPATDVRTGMDDGDPDPQARFISAMVDGVRVINVYVPNGGDVGSDKYEYKLAFLGRLRRYLDKHHVPTEPLVVCGDFNVAPEARDVHDPAAWQNETLFHAQSVEALQNVLAWGLRDALRLCTQDAGLYSWWDYRMLGFPKNRGLRIDLVLVTPPMAERCAAVVIDRNERKGKLPSDHAPVIAEFR